jgi:hypothetical protein
MRSATNRPKRNTLLLVFQNTLSWARKDVFDDPDMLFDPVWHRTVIGAEHYSVRTAHLDGGSHNPIELNPMQSTSMDATAIASASPWILTPNKRSTIATLVSASEGGAAGKTQELKPKQQGARYSCDRSCQGQLETSRRCSSMR